ncbi:MAG: UDP-N-acetylmuramoyl-L-alanine--D-glutamate ligase [Burkholderiaceae bacterium]
MHVLVLGLGESGLAMLRHLCACGAHARVADTRVEPPGLAVLRERHPDIVPVGGPFAPPLLDGIDALCVSPGLSIERGDGAALVDRARAAGLPVWGELDLFVAAVHDHAERARAQALAREPDGEDDDPARVATGADPRPRLIGITGTNGKTTVTALTTLLLEAAGLDARAAGNIGPAMLEAWHDALAAGEPPRAWVLELSSFQLAIAQPPSLDAAAILNVSQDHLDWHRSHDSYVAAKARIARRAAALVCRRDDPATRAPGASAVVTIGLDEPASVGDFGLVHEGGIVWLAEALPAEDGAPRRRGQPPAGIRLNRLMPAEALHLRGAHNHLNALAALALARRLGLPMAGMLHALREYRGEAHRCQLIASLEGVDFVDDSKGTNVGATVAALQGLDRRCWLIAGGVGKSQDFSPLIEPVRANAAGVFLIGEAASELARLLDGAAARVERCASLAEAVGLAADAAGAGEAVLLSPACASFDMFRDYRDRGRVFGECVRELAIRRGIVTELPC